MHVRFAGSYFLIKATVYLLKFCILYSYVVREKKKSEIAWLLAEIWQLMRAVRRNVDKGRCPLCLGEEDVKHILLECKETKHWRMKLIHDK
jgi:hypothetical protein